MLSLAVFMILIEISCSLMQRQLETLGAQRAGLEDMLKEMKRKVHLISMILIEFVPFYVVCHS